MVESQLNPRRIVLIGEVDKREAGGVHSELTYAERVRRNFPSCERTARIDLGRTRMLRTRDSSTSVTSGSSSRWRALNPTVSA